MHRVAISLGDPQGIGPEIVARALADASLRSQAAWVLCGDELRAREQLEKYGVKVGVGVHESAQSALCAGQVVFGGSCTSLHPMPAQAGGRFGSVGAVVKASAWGGDVSFRAVNAAIDLVRSGSCEAIVTAPISKAAWALAGHTQFPGHTELLASRFGCEDAAMMFHAAPDATARSPAGLHVVLATVHLPLARVPATLSTQRIVRVAQLGASEMQRLGVASPRVGLCGLNPHAGEGGLLGEEDDRIIAPAAAQLRAMGIDVQGPLPADTIFAKALAWPGERPSHFDLVVAMYHDQGLAPLKMLAWDRAVNMTVGLSWKGRHVIRTSPDHGTAFDIAGMGKANEGSMKAAMRVAVGQV